MAYLPSYEDDEQPSGPSWRASSPWGGASTASGDRQHATKSSAPQWSGGGGWSPAAPPADESQGKFVNFSRYLSGNRGAAGATGEALAGSVGGKAEKAQGDLSSRQTGFGKAVAAGSPFGGGQAQPSMQVASTPNTMPQAGMPSFAAAPQVAPVAQTTGTPPSAPGVGVSQQGLEGDPSGKAYDPSKDTGAPAPISAAEAQARSGQTYTGPGSLGEAPDWQSFLGEGADAASRLSNLGSDEGRQALLEEQYGGRGGYSAGGANLDAGLTGAVSGDRFRQLQAKYGDLNKQISDANAASKAQADAARKQTADLAAKYGAEVPPPAPAPPAAGQPQGAEEGHGPTSGYYDAGKDDFSNWLDYLINTGAYVRGSDNIVRVQHPHGVNGHQGNLQGAMSTADLRKGYEADKANGAWNEGTGWTSGYEPKDWAQYYAMSNEDLAAKNLDNVTKFGTAAGGALA